MSNQKTITLSPKYQTLWKSDSRYHITTGGRGSGKSFGVTLFLLYLTFKKGHKLQIQVQSTWFPLIDLNPQTYVDNIYKADEKDFKTQTHTVFTDSSIEFSVLKK